MPKISPTQITLPLARFAEVSGKSECRRDLAEGKYKSVAGGGHHMILINTEIAAVIASQMLAFSASSFQPLSANVLIPEKRFKSIAYSTTRTKPWSRSQRDCHHVAVATRGCRLMMRLMH
jgi:hypothetical protein